LDDQRNMNDMNENMPVSPLHRRRRSAAPAAGGFGEDYDPPVRPAAEGAEESAQPTEHVEKLAEAADIPAADGFAAPAAQAADSRVPAEARRMSAAPYGADSSAIPRRPGTRPMQAVRRPVQPARPAQPARRPVRPAADEDTDRTRIFDAASVGGPARGSDTTRVSVGYAPGRMSMPPRAPQEYGRNARPASDSGRNPRAASDSGRNPRTAQDYVRDLRSAQEYGRDPRDPRPMGARLPEDRPPRRAKRQPLIWILTGLLLAAGVLLVVVMNLPEDNALRVKASEIAGSIAAPVQGIFGKNDANTQRITAFTVTGNEKTTAPADVIFSVTTDSAVRQLRLADEDGTDLEADQTFVENTGSNFWTLTMRVKNGYEGLVRLQIGRSDGEWTDTEYTASVAIAPPLAGADTTPTPVPTATPAPAETPAAEAEGGDIPAAEPEGEGAGSPAGEAEGEPAGEGGTAEAPAGSAAEDADDYGDAMWGVAWNTAPADSGPGITAEPVAAPTDTPEPTPEPTPTPALTAEADPSAGPELIISSTVYDGTKKIKNYVRAAKSLIHMPAGDEYTARKIGVLTFRGNAFRQNAAVGEITSAGGLEKIWSVQAGNLRGASQNFYGYEWPGQPAIVKWSTQVRASSNIDEDKKTKTALREVIIAGVDGVIRFLDLEDGTATRNAITMGYPMKGSPSLHPAGYPYMNVGQYTRKLKNKTGSIGLRQYNLYNQKEMKLIDGLDGKMHRGLNRYGSFETSSLIDRNSDTMVTLGTNGLLYLTSLNTSFDYQAATLSTSAVTIVQATRAKGEKKNERVAVESSHAMYDRYVFYADMGGVLRCVDTNFLTTVWAVETGDAVMAAVALDLEEDGKGLNLYTANMLANRKKGNIQIRRYNALTGKETWCTEIGAAKDTKTKEDVGAKASPVIGQRSLSGLVYFTVTGLNEEGRAALGAGEETKAALVALDKETGSIRWAKALSDRSESSPVAVYDAEGNGYIIQCAEDGTVLLLDGLTGATRAQLQIEGKILASPAVYNDIMVVGTSGKGTESVVGIRIK